MGTLSEAVHHPGRLLAQSGRSISKRPFTTTGVVLLAAGAVGLYLMWPEIQRYVKIKRM
jgi:hypothetical protein